MGAMLHCVRFCIYYKLPLKPVSTHHIVHGVTRARDHPPKVVHAYVCGIYTHTRAQTERERARPLSPLTAARGAHMPDDHHLSWERASETPTAALGFNGRENTTAQQQQETARLKKL